MTICIAHRIKIFLLGLSIAFSSMGQIKLPDVELLAGFKYTPLEYLGGPLVGFSCEINEQYRLNLRKDFILGFGENTANNSYKISEYHTYNYLEVARSFSDNKYSISLGGAWIYNGSGERSFLSTSTGYYAGSVGFTLNFENLRTEIRADIPIGENQKIEDQGYLFPISFALYIPIGISKGN